MKKIRIISFALIAAMLLCVLASCSSGETGPESVYVSVYVNAEVNGKTTKIINANVVEVASEQPVISDALKNACYDKKLADPSFTVTGDIDKIGSFQAGNNNGDVYYWTCKLNGADAAMDAAIESYNKIEITLLENTYKTINVTFGATEGAKILFSDVNSTLAGEKSELTIAAALNAKDKDDKSILDKQPIVLNSDSSAIVSINGTKKADTLVWNVYVNEEICRESLNKVVLKDGDSVEFIYEEFVEETDEVSDDETTAAEETTAAAE